MIENKIIGKLKGKDCQELDIANSQIELRLAIDELGANNEFTKLNVSFSSIPYEKGSEFLRYLEDTVGGEKVFDKFIKAYIDNFRYKCLDSYQFKDFFMNYFKDIDGAKDVISSIDWDLWLKVN